MKKASFAVFLLSFGFGNAAFSECDITGSYAVKRIRPAGVEPGRGGFHYLLGWRVLCT